MDLDTAGDLQAGHAYAACSFAQQAAENAVRAILHARGAENSRQHSVAMLLGGMPELADMISMTDATVLDLLYMPSRYPDAVPGGVPGKLITQDQAEDAWRRANRIVGACVQVIAALEAAQ